jgi:hypothetical protein
MNNNRFDTLLRSLSTAHSRRTGLRLLTGSAFTGLLTLGADSTEAKNGGHGKGKNKKGKKVTLCHKGQSITVWKSAVKSHKKHGDTVGPCSSGPTGPTPPGAVLTYQCPGPKNSGVSGDGAIRFAQTFTAERSGSLRQIQFSVKKEAGTTGDYVVQLLRVSGGKPSPSPIDVLASVTIPDAEVATSSDATVTATFTGTALVAGTEYAAALSRPGVGLGEVTINTIKVGGSACGGKLFLAFQGDVFAEEILVQDALVSVRVI